MRSDEELNAALEKTLSCPEEMIKDIIGSFTPEELSRLMELGQHSPRTPEELAYLARARASAAKFRNLDMGQSPEEALAARLEKALVKEGLLVIKD